MHARIPDRHPPARGYSSTQAGELESGSSSIGKQNDMNPELKKTQLQSQTFFVNFRGDAFYSSGTTRVESAVTSCGGMGDLNHEEYQQRE